MFIGLSAFVSGTMPYAGTKTKAEYSEIRRPRELEISKLRKQKNNMPPTCLLSTILPEKRKIYPVRP
jgi:hypothetical protein